jgi:hypothetical protein
LYSAPGERFSTSVVKEVACGDDAIEHPAAFHLRAELAKEPRQENLFIGQLGDLVADDRRLPQRHIDG